MWAPTGTQAFVGEKTHVQELNGRMVLPGFHDSHCHLMDGGIELAQCELDNANTKPVVLETIKKYAKSYKEDKWIEGGGWALPSSPTRAR